MEAKFLKSMQERMASNANRSGATSELAQFRQQFDNEFNKKEREVNEGINQGSPEDAQKALDQMKTLVRSASSSALLTAHSMSRVNAIISRLQQALDERHGSSLESQKFKLSKISNPPKAVVDTENGANQLKSDPSSAVKTAVNSDTTTIMPTNANKNRYGSAKDTTLFVPHAKAAFINDCVGCTILVFPIAGSVFVSDCTNCVLYVACHQLRMKNCHEVNVYVCCASVPVIEQCDGMCFGSYDRWGGLLKSTLPDGSAYNSHLEWVQKVGEIQNPERIETSFKVVHDFQWLKKLQSPHWRVLDAEEMQECEVFSAPERLAC